MSETPQKPTAADQQRWLDHCLERYRSDPQSRRMTDEVAQREGRSHLAVLAEAAAGLAEAEAAGITNPVDVAEFAAHQHGEDPAKVIRRARRRGDIPGPAR